MAVTVVIDGVNSIHVVVDPLAELGAILHAVTHGDHHPRARPLRERLHEHRNDELFALAAYFRPFYGAIRARYLLPIEATPDHVGIHDRIESLKSIGEEPFAGQSLISLLEFTRDLRIADALSDCELRKHLLERANRISPTRMEIAQHVMENPADVIARFTQFLHAASDEWFEPEWERIRPHLQAERLIRGRRLADNIPAALLEIAPAATESLSPHSITFDKINHDYVTARPEGILLVPSVHQHPHLFVKSDPGLPVVIAYDVEPTTFDMAKLTRQRIAVLNDPARIEICRAILRTPHTTSDLATKMRMSQPQMSRHLRALREARLVTVEHRGRYALYSLDARALATIGAQLLSQLHR